MTTQIKDYKLVWYNFSGDMFEDMYTEEEANILFEHKQMTSSQVELIPPFGNWFTVWNRKLDKCFDCHK
jgi:hypothetical protein